MSAVMLELGQKPALVLRRFADGTLQADVRGELEAEMEVYWIPWQQSHGLGEENVRGARIVRGDRMWAVIKELGI